MSLAVVFTLPQINPLDGDGWFTYAVGVGGHVAGLDIHHVNEGIHHAHHDAMNISLLVATLGILLSSLFYFFKKVNVEKLTGVMNLMGLYSLSKNKLDLSLLLERYKLNF